MAKLKFKAADGNIYSTHDLLRDKIGDNNLAVKLPSGNVGYLPTELVKNGSIESDGFIYIYIDKVTSKVIKVGGVDKKLPNSNCTILKINPYGVSGGYAYVPAGEYITGTYYTYRYISHSTGETDTATDDKKYLIDYVRKACDYPTFSESKPVYFYILSLNTDSSGSSNTAIKFNARTAEWSHSDSWSLIDRNITTEHGQKDFLTYNSITNTMQGLRGCKVAYYAETSQQPNDPDMSPSAYSFSSYVRYRAGLIRCDTDPGYAMTSYTESDVVNNIRGADIMPLARNDNFYVKLVNEEYFIERRQGSGGIYYARYFKRDAGTGNLDDKTYMARVNVPLLFVAESNKTQDLAAPTVT